jgi:putative transposase
MSVHVDPYRIGQPDPTPIQPYVNLTGLTVVIGRPHDPDRKFYFVPCAIPPSGSHPRLWRLEPLKAGEASLHLSDEEIVHLEARGEFRPAIMDPGTGLMKGRSPTITLLDPARAKGALLTVYWLRKYVATHGLNKWSEDRFDAFMAKEQEASDAPPRRSFSTVYREYKKNEQSLWFDPVGVATPKAPGGGRKRDPWGPKVVAHLQAAMGEVLRLPKPSGQDVLDRLIQLAGADGIPPEELPKIRTVQERIREVPEVVRDILSLGYEKAERMHGHTQVRVLPDRPLEVVEADEVQLDLEVLDDAEGINLGRPFLLMILDRMTGIVLSAVLGFRPSFAMFAEAVRMAIYPKDMSGYEGVEWPWYGPFESVRLDAASWYRGKELDHLSLGVGFDVDELVPGEPRMKGSLEALNGHINRALSHKLPGAVMGNVAERKTYEETRSPPLLTLGELRFLVCDWICNHRNVKTMERHGAYGITKAVPDVLWRNNIGNAKDRRPIDSDMFRQRFGPTSERTIQAAGIRIDKRFYWSDDLHLITAHKEHKPGKGKHGGTPYTCIRDPNDLGRIHVVNPYADPRRGSQLIECRVVAAHRAYAEGLPLDVHERFKAEYEARIKKDARTAETPERQKAKAVEAALRARAMRHRLGLGEWFARFMKGQRERRIASEIRPATVSSAASTTMIDMRNPPSVPPTEARSPSAPPGSPDPARPAEARRRYAKSETGIKEVDRGKPAQAGEPLSRLRIDLDRELDELNELRNQKD